MLLHNGGEAPVADMEIGSLTFPSRMSLQEVRREIDHPWLLVFTGQPQPLSGGRTTLRVAFGQ